MMLDRLLSAALIATVIAGLSLVCISAAQTQSGAREPSPQRGAVIAAQGTPNGAPACAQCHAFNGVSDGSGAFPRIAGQSAYYLAKQLRDFTSGIRVNAIMTPVAGALTADGRGTMPETWRTRRVRRRRGSLLCRDRSALPAAAAYYEQVQLPIEASASQ
jgi:cytochrome c553